MLYTIIHWLLMFYLRGPLLQPCFELLKIMTSCFFKVNEVHRIIDMREWIEIAEANLHRIPTGECIIHKRFSPSLFLLLAFLKYLSRRDTKVTTFSTSLLRACECSSG